MNRPQPLSKKSIRALRPLWKILSGDDDDKLYMEILEANHAIASWQNDHPDKEDMVDVIDLKRIEEIVVRAHFWAAKFEKRFHQHKSESTVSY